MLKAIHAQESRKAADRKARAIVDDLRADCSDNRVQLSLPPISSKEASTRR